MENKYDVIVIGAGSAGLVAALTLQKKGKRVLILEKENMVGGSSTSFRRGRFEFEVSDESLGDYGGQKKGELYDLFCRLGIQNFIQMKEIDEAFHVISQETKEEFTMPTRPEKFIAKMEYYVKGSKDAMIRLFSLCDEMKEAYDAINAKDYLLNIEELKKQYPNFVQLGPENVQTVLKAIHMPSKAIEILSTYWVYFGLSITELSFVHYALFLKSFVGYVPCIPNKTPHEISVILESEIKKLGGVIRLNEEVGEIITTNNHVTKVLTKEHEYETSQVISCISPSIVYGKFIHDDSILKNAFPLYNKRTLGTQMIKVYLGLNKKASDLGLTHYTYFIQRFLDNEKEMKTMEHFPHQNVYATVVNYVDEYASPTNTTKMILTSLILNHQFEKNVNEQNYYNKKEEWARHMIHVFEKGTNIEITPFIEEIEVATPVTFAHKVGALNGVVDGYSFKAYDNILSRALNQREEDYVEGLRFCGSYVTSGLSNVYLNGEKVAKELLYEEK